ncbi:hypothetical protein [Aureispira sp. CCB-E]|uniref:hypothetical protein n=1 Tax=Aureispira sp. CCB-E TaxID=3051121 RepID=UPI0028690604|nr:hypothetical protein [Aureispira sp. CCB-E]WMX16599.1 hypothetical protein QP953_09495 [Aureispira sp. CCB-E]
MSTNKSNSNDSSNTKVEQNATNTLSNKDKLILFVEKNKTPILGFSSIVVLLILVVVLYYSFANKGMDEFADDFCNCAAVDGSDFYAYSKDGFGYRSDLVGCFAEDFRQYGKRYNKATKKALLLEFQKEVVKKCPEKLAGVFEYK